MKRKLEFKLKSSKVPFSHQIMARENGEEWYPCARAGRPLIYKTLFEAEAILKAMKDPYGKEAGE